MSVPKYLLGALLIGVSSYPDAGEQRNSIDIKPLVDVWRVSPLA
jgi:hypothetical protein